MESKEGKDTELIFSRRRAKHMRTWASILRAEGKDVILSKTDLVLTDDELIEKALIKRRTKGGFVVDISGIEAFLSSDLDLKEESYIAVQVVKVDEKAGAVEVIHVQSKDDSKDKNEVEKEKEEDVKALRGALDRDHDGGILDNLG